MMGWFAGLMTDGRIVISAATLSVVLTTELTMPNRPFGRVESEVMWAALASGYPLTTEARKMDLAEKTKQTVAKNIGQSHEKITDDLAEALEEAMQWNWLDDDIPNGILVKCGAALETYRRARHLITKLKMNH